MRDNFNKQLELLYEELKEMGEICISAMENARIIIVEPGLTDRQLEELKQTVRHSEEEIDHKERSIEGLCTRLFLREQPVASDLRKVSAALKMISDMERIGDQAYDIAELSDYITCRDYGMIHIKELFDAAIGQVRSAVLSFTEGSLNRALNVIRDDDRVDELFNKVKHELIGVIKTCKDEEACLDLLMVAKYLERVGDHAVNIAEWVEYSVTGSR